MRRDDVRARAREVSHALPRLRDRPVAVQHGARAALPKGSRRPKTDGGVGHDAAIQHVRTPPVRASLEYSNAL